MPFVQSPDGAAAWASFAFPKLWPLPGDARIEFDLETENPWVDKSDKETMYWMWFSHVMMKAGEAGLIDDVASSADE